MYKSKRSQSYFNLGLERYKKKYKELFNAEIVKYDCYTRKATLKYQCGHEYEFLRPQRSPLYQEIPCPVCLAIQWYNDELEADKAIKTYISKKNNTEEIKEIKREKMLNHWKNGDYDHLNLSEEDLKAMSNYKDWTPISYGYKNRNNTCTYRHKCGYECETYIYREPICQVCNPNASRVEIELIEFCKNLGFKNTQKLPRGAYKYELDIYIPELRVGFEYNGDYWHSSIFHDSGYHKRKVEYFLDKDIKMYSLWEYWGLDKCKSIILSKLGKSSRIYARKCEVVVLNNSDVKLFLEENHTQGFRKSDIIKGLKYNDELYAVMCFNKINEGYELSRFCQRLNTTVIGGFSKLLNQFSLRPIVTYAFRDLNPVFSDTVYYSLGFTYIHTNPPSMRYCDVVNREVIQRRNLQKKKH